MKFVIGTLYNANPLTLYILYTLLCMQWVTNNFRSLKTAQNQFHRVIFISQTDTDIGEGNSAYHLYEICVTLNTDTQLTLGSVFIASSWSPLSVIWDTLSASIPVTVFHQAYTFHMTCQRNQVHLALYPCHSVKPLH